MGNPWRRDLTEIHKLFNSLSCLSIKQGYPYRAITDTEHVPNEPKAEEVTTGDGKTAIQRRNEKLQIFCVLITISDSPELWFSNNVLVHETMVQRIMEELWHNRLQVLSEVSYKDFLSLRIERSKSWSVQQYDLLLPMYMNAKKVVKTLTLVFDYGQILEEEQKERNPQETARVSSRLFGHPIWTPFILVDPKIMTKTFDPG
jgi:hypothetical protein